MASPFGWSSAPKIRHRKRLPPRECAKTVAHQRHNAYLAAGKPTRSLEPCDCMLPDSAFVEPEPEADGVLEIESGPDREPEPEYDATVTNHFQAQKQGLHGGRGATPPGYTGAYLRSQRKVASSPVEPEPEPSGAPVSAAAAEHIETDPSQSKRRRVAEWMRSRETIFWIRVGGASAVSGVVIALLAWLFPQGQ